MWRWEHDPTRGQTFTEDNELLVKSTQEWGNEVESDITSTAWGIRKASLDYSIFHALFTYDVPERIWNWRVNWVEEDISRNLNPRILSNWGTLNVVSDDVDWNTVCLQSRRHPRYQPNRGHLFSSSVFIYTASVTWIRRWGLYTQDSNCDPVNGVLYEWDGTNLYGCIYSNWVEKTRDIIDTSTIPNFNIEKGNLFDIQFQWRWVGDYFFFLNQKLVHVVRNTGQLDEVSVANPGLPISFTNKTVWSVWTTIWVGCVDVTSEWGKKEGLTYSSFSNDIWVTQGRAVSGQDNPLLIIKSKDLYLGKINTRDVEFLRLSVSSDQKSIGKVYITRDPTAIWGTVGLNLQDKFSDSVLEYQDCTNLSTTELTFDKTKAILFYSSRVPQDGTLQVWNPSENVEVILTAWDYLVLTWEREQGWNANMFWTLEFWEEI